MAIQRLGLLTSGGDCAGLNAVIRAVCRRARHYGWAVEGIVRGTDGLLQRPPASQILGDEMADSLMLRLGGTLLGTTNKGNPFAYPMADGSRPDRSAEIIDGAKLLALDAVIGIGGDGSLDILHRLFSPHAIPFIGIPKTIDNDLSGTERAIGHSTAVAVATEALDRLQPTAASHSRVMVLEVMGRDAGHIALAAGIAGGADVILIPEIPWSLAAVTAAIDAIRQGGRNFALVVVAEAVPTDSGATIGTLTIDGKRRYGGIGAYLAEQIEQATGAETRVTVLGHIQRGGAPGAEDRILASALGVRAVDLLAEGKRDRMVGWWNRQVVDVPLTEVVTGPHLVDAAGPLVHTARGLGICLGDA